MPEIRKQYDEALQPLIGPGGPFEVERRTVDGVMMTYYKNAPQTMLEVFAPAYEHVDKEFVLYEGERWSFDDVLSQAAAIGYQLKERVGIKAGDRVAIAMRNFPEWMSAYIGIVSIGAVVVPLNSWGTARELGYALEDAGARAVFCDEQRYASISSIDVAGELLSIVVRGNEVEATEQCCSLQEFIAGAGGVSMPAAEISPEDHAMIMYTSGTTGKPKGALSTHAALGQAISNFECTGTALAMSNMDIIGKMMAKGLDAVSLLAVPLFHVSGCHAQFLLNLRAGRRLVMMYKWDSGRAMELIEQEKITTLSAAPSMLLDLLDSPDFGKHDLSSLSGMGVGGAATPAKAIQLMNDQVPDHFSGTGWGMTETNAVGSSMTGAAFNRNNGSAGFVHPCVEIEIRDDLGVVQPHGSAGTIWVKSPSLVKEYWNRPDANATEFVDGWFNSGDVGYTTEHGYLYLSDRAKDMVIRGGENIYPAEIENQLLELEGVQEAAAYGIPHERLGEELAVTVVPKVGVTLDESAIRHFCRENLAAFKVPSLVFISEEPLPRTATNKVMKQKVKETAMAKHQRLG